MKFTVKNIQISLFLWIFIVLKSFPHHVKLTSNKCAQFSLVNLSFVTRTSKHISRVRTGLGDKAVFGVSSELLTPA